MPSRGTSKDLVTRNVFLLYYLWKRRGFSGSISELSKQLGYPSDSPVNKRLNSLIADGYVKEVRTKHETKFKVTRKGMRKIQFLILPHWILLILIILSFGYIYYGIAWTMDITLVGTEYLIIMGIMSTIASIGLLLLYRSSSKMLLQPLSENEID